MLFLLERRDHARCAFLLGAWMRYESMCHGLPWIWRDPRPTTSQPPALPRYDHRMPVSAYRIALPVRAIGPGHAKIDNFLAPLHAMSRKLVKGCARI